MYIIRDDKLSVFYYRCNEAQIGGRNHGTPTGRISLTAQIDSPWKMLRIISRYINIEYSQADASIKLLTNNFQPIIASHRMKCRNA